MTKNMQIIKNGGMFIEIPGHNIIQIFKPGIKYLIHDDFLVADPAPVASPRAAEPGPGTALIRDIETDKLSIADGWLEWAAQATPAWNDQDIVYDTPVITREAGRAFLLKWRCATAVNHQPIVFVDSTTPNFSGVNNIHGLYQFGDANLYLFNKTISTPCKVVSFAADGTQYWLCGVLLSTGCMWFIKGGTYSNWTLIYVERVNSDATLYAASANYSGVFSTSHCKIPRRLFSPVALLSDTFAGTWPTPDGIGENWVDIGTWSLTGGVVKNTPLYNVNTIVNGDFPTDLTGWTLYTGVSGGTIVWDTGQIKFTQGASATYMKAYQAQSVVAGKWYRFRAANIAGYGFNYLQLRIGTSGGGDEIASTALFGASSKTLVFRAPSTGTVYASLVDAQTTGSSFWDNITLSRIPISSLVANMELVTSDVFTEEIIHSFTLGTQAGIIQSDRPFAFPANADAASGQAIIVLKGLTHAVTTNETITIKHPIAGGTNYVIAGVGALSAGVQSITLNSNLVEAVSEDDAMGVDWSAWNGTLTYFDGKDAIQFYKIVAGVYTDLGGDTKAFSADKILSVSKIGSTYRIFYDNALVGAAVTTVDAAAMAGQYCGMFLSDAVNEITSFIAHDTGTVTNAHAALDKYTR